MIKELEKVHKYLDAQLFDFEERLKNCKKVIEENAFAIKQQEKFMETVMGEGKEGDFESRIKKETIEQNRAAEEKKLHALKEEGRQRAFLYKSLETQHEQIAELKKNLLKLEEEKYVFIKTEEILKKIEEATKEAVKETKKAVLKEVKEASKKEDKKVTAKESKKSEDALLKEDILKQVSDFADTVENFAFMDPGRVLQELEVLKNRLQLS